MVRIQVKHGGDDCSDYEFLYDCQTSSTIEEITKGITEIANLQLQIVHLGRQLLPRLSALLHTDSQVIALHRALSEATSYVSQDQVLHGRQLSSVALRDHINSIDKEFSVSCQAFEFPESNLGQMLSDLELLQEEKVQLWWAGKEFAQGKILRDYIGKNEKTKIMLRLQSLVSSPPCGNVIDEAGDASSRSTGP